jgi:hypothetical protein
MLLTGRSETFVAFTVNPRIPVSWVDLQNRLKFSAATIDAALHEGHVGSLKSEPIDSEAFDSSARLRHRGQYQGAGVLTGLGLRLRHLAHKKRLPFTAVFGRFCFPVL